MSPIENIQNKLLAKHGYANIAPLWNEYGKLCGKWCYQMGGIFHVVDGYLDEEKRGRTLPSGSVLLRLCEDGYHICTASQKDKSSLYSIKDSTFFIVYENNGYNELSYLSNNDVDDSLSFEYLNTQTYIALLFHKKDVDKGVISTFVDRYETEIKLDCIVSKYKDIFHEDVFTYFYKNLVVVYDGETTFIYNNNFDIVYERCSYLRIWEVEDKVYLLFLSDKVVYELDNGKEISLSSQNSCDWYYAWAYKNYIILYNQNYYQIERRDTSYYDDEYDWAYDDEPVEVPVRNTKGHIFNSSFNLLREFNALGEITELKDIGNAVIMKTTSPNTSNDVDSYFNISLPNITRHNDKTNEDFSVPDISLRLLECSDVLEELYVVKTRVSSSDTIDLRTDTKKNFWAEKCGVYMKSHSNKEEYVKIVDCKYDYIIALPLNNDENVYYAGINGKGKYGVFDLYINHAIKLKEIPYIEGASSLKIVNNGNFIQFSDKIGNVGVIRDGKTILEPLYKELTIYVKCKSFFDSNDYDEKRLEFMFVVSDGKSYGICSPKGKLVLPIEYSLIDVDEELLVILEHNDSDIIEVGYYDEQSESFKHEEAQKEDGLVRINDDYVWDGRFRYLHYDGHLEWTDQELRDSADIAYEGNSRLYLGLED